MGLIRLRRPWTEQPQSGIAASSLAQQIGCQILMTPDSNNVAGRLLDSPTVAGTVSTGPGIDGVMRTYAGGSDRHGLNNLLLGSGGGYWFVFRGYISTVGTWGTLFGVTDSPDTSWIWGWFRSGSNNVLSVQHGSSIYNPRALNDLLDTRVRTWVGTWVPSGAIKLWRGGELVMNNTATNAPTGTAGNLRQFAGTDSSGSWSLRAYGTGILPDHIAQYISLNPWELFQPRTTPIPLAAAGGGGLPTLSNARATSITTTTAVPAVDYVY